MLVHGLRDDECDREKIKLFFLLDSLSCSVLFLLALSAPPTMTTTVQNLSDLLPPNFSGSETENAKLFGLHFKRSATNTAIGLSWSDDTAVTFFLTWLTGSASEWSGNRLPKSRFDAIIGS